MPKNTSPRAPAKAALKTAAKRAVKPPSKPSAKPKPAAKPIKPAAKSAPKPATKSVPAAAKRKPAAKSGKTTASKALSPRGRGSVAQADDDRLRDLFAENMRRVRVKRQMSQDALGDLCDLDRTYVGSVERKKRNVSIRNIQRIADALQVDVRVLFDPQLAIDKQFGG